MLAVPAVEKSDSVTVIRTRIPMATYLKSTTELAAHNPKTLQAQSTAAGANTDKLEAVLPQLLYLLGGCS